MGDVGRTEVPRSVDAGDGRVDRVFEPLGDPVRCKSYEYDETDDFGFTTTTVGAVRVVVARLVLGINGHECDRVPYGERHGAKAADHAHDEDMPMVLGDTNGSIKHQCAERYARDPADEGDNQKD